MNDLQRIITLFREISAVPRETFHQDHIGTWIDERAAAHGWTVRRDSYGNGVVVVPASSGRESEPIVILQAHTDMVADAVPGVGHDFRTDPILPIRDGDWLRAEGTTLGADNGIGVAIALAIAESAGVSHPPLELLFTADEEISMSGVTALDASMVTGRQLFNLDNEDFGVLIVGCAGARTSEFTVKPSREATPPGGTTLRVSVGGLRGGHSGADIHRPRASATALLARILSSMTAGVSLRLADLRADGELGGHWSREAWADIAVGKTDDERIRRNFADIREALLGEWAEAEPDITIDLTETAEIEQVLTVEDSQRLVHLMRAIPQGVIYRDPVRADQVDTSTNWGYLRTESDGRVVLKSMHRSNRMTRLDDMAERFRALASLAGVGFHSPGGYPAWTPEWDGEWLQRTVRLWESTFTESPQVGAVHAGLECGTLKGKIPDMAMVSLGPTVRDAHSPSERVHLPSVEAIYRFLVAALAPE